MPAYTVMGGGRRDRIRKYPYRLTVLILSRGDRLFRSELLRQVQSMGFAETVWVDGPGGSHDLESLSREFPEARFLLVNTETSRGELIDIGVAESRAPLVLCLWSDSRIVSFSPSLLDSPETEAVVCSLPLMRNARSEILPTLQSPVLKKGKLSLQFRTPSADREKALFPFDYCGLYAKERFAQVGGFDAAIVNPYWQKLDFGFRCHLWGERIRVTTEITLMSANPPPPEDATPDEGYKAFFLKNLAVRFRNEMGSLPAGKVLDYVLHSNTGPLSAIREFRLMRDWVSRSKFRFRHDPRELIEKWRKP